MAHVTEIEGSEGPLIVASETSGVLGHAVEVVQPGGYCFAPKKVFVADGVLWRAGLSIRGG